MKFILVTILSTFIFACSNNEVNCSGELCSKSFSDIKEGRYQFKELLTDELSGSLDIIKNNDNTYTVSQLSVFRSRNFNNTYGTHPKVLMNNILKNKTGLLVYEVDLNYTSGDLEKDGTTSDLGNGKHYTIYKLYKDINGKLNLMIQIHDGSLSENGGINEIVIERNFIEL